MMEDEQFEIIGDDGELLPRKPKPFEGMTTGNVIILMVMVAIVAAVTGSIATVFVTSALNTAPPQATQADAPEMALASTIAAIQLTQVAMADSSQAASSWATQAALIAQSAPAAPPTQLPPDQCYCDNPNCQPEAGNWMEPGDSFEALSIASSNPEAFGWYIVRNLSETSGVHWEVYPADHAFVCAAHWNNCQVRGFYTTHECALSQRYRLCDRLDDCQFSEPLTEP